MDEEKLLPIGMELWMKAKMRWSSSFQSVKERRSPEIAKAVRWIGLREMDGGYVTTDPRHLDLVHETLVPSIHRFPKILICYIWIPVDWTLSSRLDHVQWTLSSRLESCKIDISVVTTTHLYPS